MNKLLFGLAIIFFGATSIQAQKYFTRDGQVSFYSDSPLEKIEAENDKLNCVLDYTSGRLQFAALVQAFHFENALMQEHFNENYMESEKFPKAIFKGQTEDLGGDIVYDKEIDIRVKGELTIHGVTQMVETVGTIIFNQDGTVAATSVFNIRLEDYGVKIPGVVKDNIAEVVEIKVNVDLAPLNK